MIKLIRNIHLSFILKLLLVLSLGALILPLMPMMPGTSLDPSWGMGMIQALVQGAQFGQDLVFTFGPYSFLYTKAYHPALTYLIWSSTLLFTVGYLLLCWQLFANIHRFWLLMILVLFGFLVQSQDSVFLAYPLLFGVWLWKNIDTHIETYANSLLVFLSGLLGLLILVKGSFVIEVVGVLILCAALLLYRRRYLSFLLLCLAPVVFCIGFWLLTQTSLTNLTLYFLSAVEFSQGYTEAMALRHEIHDAILFAAASASLLMYLFYKIKANTKTKSFDKATPIFLGLLFAYVLFLSFKAGLVRNDLHSIIAGNMLWLSAVLIWLITHPHPQPSSQQLLITIKQSKWLKTLCALLCLCLLSIQARYVVASIVLPQIHYQIPLIELGRFLTHTLSDQSWEDQYQQGLNAIAHQHPLPTLTGTSDIYEHQQAALLASNNIWNPRPVFQSYAAYTPKLAQINQGHLLSDHAPDHLFFNVEPIDNRYPTLNDGLSWPVLLQHYQPSPIQTKDFLILDRASSAKTFMPPTTIHEQSAQLNEQITVPNLNKPVFVELHIEPSLFGKIAATLYKTSELRIEVALDNGEIKQHRIIANMTKTGFVISPYVASRDDFAKLYLSKNDLARVRSFKVMPYNGSWLWKDNYQVIFKQI